jgi:hypothetical protein
MHKAGLGSAEKPSWHPRSLMPSGANNGPTVMTVPLPYLCLLVCLQPELIRDHHKALKLVREACWKAGQVGQGVTCGPVTSWGQGRAGCCCCCSSSGWLSCLWLGEEVAVALKVRGVGQGQGRDGQQEGSAAQFGLCSLQAHPTGDCALGCQSWRCLTSVLMTANTVAEGMAWQ